jgi:hypothetical protein
MYGDGRFSARKRYLPGALARSNPEASTPVSDLLWVFIVCFKQ